MKKYYRTIITILFFGLLSCSNDETKTQNQVAARPTVPIQAPTVIDIDGNTYRIVTIGNQSWTKTNLNVSHYRNGDPIPQVTDPTQWVNLTTGAWCYYENNTANGTVYGKLYNWYAVNDPRGLAPTGYHVPSDAQWTTLTNFLGGAIGAGDKMKASTGWIPYFEITSTNSSGFTGLPGGYRTANGAFNSIGYNGSWWSSSETDTAYAWGHYLSHYNGYAGTDYGKKLNGFSVRCLRD